MRLYTFVNMYLSDKQRGIQSAHVLGELFNVSEGKKRRMLQDWNKNHKTMIVLNGGYSSNLLKIYNELIDDGQFPVASFHEEQDALNGALTAVGVVVPEPVYILAKQIKSGNIDPSIWVNQYNKVAKIISEYDLA